MIIGESGIFVHVQSFFRIPVDKQDFPVSSAGCRMDNLMRFIPFIQKDTVLLLLFSPKEMLPLLLKGEVGLQVKGEQDV